MLVATVTPTFPFIRMKTLDLRIDGFVEEWRAQGAHIRPIEGAPWITVLERRARHTFPRTYRSLVCRYAYTALPFKGGELLGNAGDGSDQDISYRMFC